MVHAKTPDRVRLYHKPTCTKSRGAKEILDAAGVDYEEIRYMETPPSYDELKVIAKVLDGEVRELLRDKEAKESGWDHDGNASDEDILRFLAEHPAALQRPLVVRGDRAIIGRPPEKVEMLLKDERKHASRSGNKPASAPGPAAGEHLPPKQYGRR